MSGIGVIFSRSGGDVLDVAVTTMCSALRMYGPAYQRVTLEGSIGLAYAHTSFTPQSIDEQQPVRSGLGRFLMVFDGRLDNREALAGKLQISLAELSNLSDSALAMRAWERWQRDLPEHLLGEFALIVWDAAEERVFAARDHFGFRTLSYHVGDDHLIIASAPKAVLAAAGIERRIDSQKIADALADFHDDGARSFYEGVSRIPPAHQLVADPSTISVQRYWSLEYRGHDIALKNDQEYVEAGIELLTASTKACVRSNGLVGAELSGGLDSPAVVVSALDQLKEQERLPVFTHVPEPEWTEHVASHRYPSERPFVEQIVAMHPRLDPTFLNGEGLSWDHALNENFDASEVVSWSPTGNMTDDVTFRAAQRQGVKVMLCGHGGNATLSWGGEGAYSRWLMDGKPGRLLSELRTISNGQFLPVRRFVSKAVLPIAPDWLWRLYARWKNGSTQGAPWSNYSLINPDFARRMQVERRAEAFGFNFYGRPPRDSRDLRARALTGDLANEMGEHNQGMRALYGIEYRDPTYDVRIAEWCLRIPEEQYLRFGQKRWLIRRMLEGRVPDQVRLNRKRGAIVPDWHHRMSRDLPNIREQLEILADDPDVVGVIDVPRIRKLLNDWPSQVPTESDDPLSWMLPRCLPHALATGRFIRRLKGANL